MAEHKTLKPKQLDAIKMLVTGTPIYQVAEKLQVTSMTLWRWRKLPEFEQTLNAVSYSGLDELAKKVNVAALTAAETLQEILCSLNEPTDVRMKAALGVLRAMPGINTVLEKSLQHRAADFDLRKRFSGPAFTHSSDGQPYPFLQRPGSSGNAVNSAEVVEV